MRKTILVAAAFGIFGPLALSLPGCGDSVNSGSGGSGGSGEVTLDAACKSLTAAICGRIDTCYPFLLELGYGDVATCEARVAPQCLATPDLAGAKVGPAEIQACAGSYASQTCADWLGGVVPDGCDIAGDKADGATCAAGSQCKSGTCKNGPEGTCGACITPLAAGAACDAATDVCEAGLFCDTSSKCAAKAASGAPCAPPDKPCESDLSCNNDVCGPPLAEGANCAGGQTCDFGVGLFCSPLTDKCEKVVLVDLGAKCGFDQASGEIRACKADLECDGQQSVCIAKLKEGDACTIDPESGASRCASGFQCIAGKCSTGFPACN